jgi:predicted AAA+ superfamily ATPase
MIPRTLQTHIKKMAEVFPVVAVTGPRQSGKTTLVKANFPNYAYVNLENLDDRSAAIEDPRLFLKYHGRQGVIIDEIQKVPELFSYLQQIADETDKMGNYIITGSQNFLLMEKVTQSLAGRVSINNLLPFSIDEFPQKKILNKDLNQILYTGMYPAIYDRKILPENYYPSYLQTYVERDVRSLKNIANLNLFQRFLKLCAGRTGQLLNLSNIGNELGIDGKTVRSWLSILEASFIIFLLPPYFNNFKKRIVKHPKLYFYDTGLACSLLGLKNSEQLIYHYLRGAVFENFIISEYLKIKRHQGINPNIYFWQDNSGNEIDMLIDDGGSLKAVEIKSGTTINQDFFRNLTKFQKFSGTTAENSYLVYGGEQSIPRKNGQVLSWRDLQQLNL